MEILTLSPSRTGLTAKRTCRENLLLHLGHLYLQEAKKKFSEKQKGFRDGHIPPLKKAKKQGEMPLPSRGSIQSLNSTFF